MQTIRTASRLGKFGIGFAGLLSGLWCLPALAEPAQSVALRCTRTSAVPTEPSANWVQYFDLKVDLAAREIDKTTTLKDGGRHDVIKNGEVTSNEAYTRTGVVIVEPDVLRFGYNVAPKDGAASFQILSTVDRLTGAAVDNLSEFLCRRQTAEHLF